MDKFDIGATGFVSSTLWLYSCGHWIAGTVSLVLLLIAASKSTLQV